MREQIPMLIIVFALAGFVLFLVRRAYLKRLQEKDRCCKSNHASSPAAATSFP